MRTGVVRQDEDSNAPKKSGWVVNVNYLRLADHPGTKRWDVILVRNVPAQRERTSMRVPLSMARISLLEVLHSRSINALLFSDRLPGAAYRGLWGNRIEEPQTYDD